MMETHCTDLKDNTLRTANSIRVGRHQEIKQEEEEAKIVLENHLKIKATRGRRPI